MQRKVTDLARFWLSDCICISVEQKQTTDPELYRSEHNGSGTPWRNQPGLIKFLIHILCKKKKKKKWELCSDLQLELYFCSCLVTPLSTCVISVFIMLMRNFGPRGRTERVASPTVLPLPKGRGIRQYIW